MLTQPTVPVLRTVTATSAELPTVMVVFDGSWFDQTYRGSEPAGIDRTFAWRGSADVLLITDGLDREGGAGIAERGHEYGTVTGRRRRVGVRPVRLRPHPQPRGTPDVRRPRRPDPARRRHP